MVKRFESAHHPYKRIPFHLPEQELPVNDP